MTGFGRALEMNDDYKLSIEIKSLNHRYLDINIKMPKKFNQLESRIRKIISEKVKRGKIDVLIGYENYKEKVGIIRYNEEVARVYVDIADKIEDKFGILNNLNTNTLMRFDEVISFVTDEDNIEEYKTLIDKNLTIALNNFNESRIKEGEHLKEDLLSKLELIKAEVKFIEENIDLILEEYKEKIKNKIEDLLENKNVDETRVLMEVSIYADRTCIDEEVTRLKSHVKSLEGELEKGGTVGKKLDFIAQEMNREANTILSKSSNIDIVNRGILLKTEIEKIREQIQNLE